MGVWRSFFSARIWLVTLMGFSSGLPLALTGGTLQAWMKEEGVDLSTIGLFALAGLPYTLKFTWAPLLDRFSISHIGRRKTWLYASQVGLFLSLMGISTIHPSENAWGLAALALLISFLSATQDIAVDAYRREILPENELGLGSSMAVNGYRVAFQFVGGALALILADHLPWQDVYQIMACLAGAAILVTAFAPEPKVTQGSPKTIKEAVIGPFKDFFFKPDAITILAFILFYKLGDQMASQMTVPFYLDMGFSKTEFAAIGKSVGLAGTLLGGTLGGLLIIRIGIARALWIFGVFQALSTLGFAVLYFLGKDLTALTVVLAVETSTAGMGSAAYVAFMASVTNRKFTATQYALLTSLMGVPRIFFGAPTGFLASELGWPQFFIFCALIAAPGMWLVTRVAPWNSKPSPEENS